MYQLLPTPDEMAHWDKVSMEEYNFLPEMLMENASREIFHTIQERFPRLSGKRAILFAGSGNNGGDAFALARHLAQERMEVLVLHTRTKSTYKGATRYHMNLAKKLDIPLVYLKRYNLDFLPGADILVDGLLGTGFQGQLKENYQQWISILNKVGRDAFVVSIDIPSGLNGFSGQPCPTAVKADITVTFEEPKLGLVREDAGAYTGEVVPRKIGIPDRIKKDYPPSHMGLTAGIKEKFPQPAPNMHKGTAGHLLILGGSTGLTGAPLLAGLAALRAGSGLVTIGCPAETLRDIKSVWPDIMAFPAGTSGKWDTSCITDVQSRLSAFDALVIGPGMGRNKEVVPFLQKLFSMDLPPCLVDADGLYHLSTSKELLDSLPPKTILTPHPGEMARLLTSDVSTVQASRFRSATKLAEKRNAVVVLKGAGTVLASKDRPALFSPFFEPVLSVGGSGDVLSGVIGSLLARKVNVLEAACLGVYWHGLSGTHLKQKYPFRGNLAQEIAHQLPHTLKEWMHENS